MNLLNRFQNNNTLLCIFATLIPSIWTSLLIYKNFPLGGVVVLLIPLLFFTITSHLFRIYLIIGLFFIQRYSFQKGLITIFPIDIVFIIFVSYSFFHYLIRRKEKSNGTSVKNPIFIPYLIFIISCFLSVITNLYRYDDIMFVTSIWYFVRLIQLLLAIILISSLETSHKFIETVFDAVIACALFQLPFALLQIQSGSDMIGTLTNHHGFLGTLLLIPFFLSIYKAISSYKLNQSKLQKIYYLSSTVIILYMIYGSGCRSALLGLLVSFVFYVLSLLVNKNIKATLLTLFLFLILTVISLKFTPLENVIEESFNNSETNGNMDLSSISRLLIWKYTVLNFIQFPIYTKITGIGVGTFGFLNQHFVLWAGNQTFSGAHLNLLHILVETGILGLLCFLTLFFVKFTFFYNNRMFVLAKSGFYMNIALSSQWVSPGNILVSTCIWNPMVVLSFCYCATYKANSK